MIRWGRDGHRWLRGLEKRHVGYSIAQAQWARGPDSTPRQLCDVHTAFVGEDVAMALVTDLSGDVCDFGRSHHACCTRMSNKIGHRPRGTVWDNRGLIVLEVAGWEGALRAIGLIAAQAALENGTNDPYRSDTFFGPKRWGRPRTYALPTEAVSDRTILPTSATLALIEPDARPLHLTRGQLIHEAEAAIDAVIAEVVPIKLANVRPFHRRRHRDGPAPEFSDHPRFIGPADLVAPLAEEDEYWRQHYNRCRDEFPERQDVAFPAGTIRFRRLGAACDPCKPHRRAPCPPHSKPYNGPPPPDFARPAQPGPTVNDRAPPR